MQHLFIILFSSRHSPVLAQRVRLFFAGGGDRLPVEYTYPVECDSSSMLHSVRADTGKDPCRIFQTRFNRVPVLEGQHSPCRGINFHDPDHISFGIPEMCLVITTGNCPLRDYYTPAILNDIIKACV